MDEQDRREMFAAAALNALLQDQSNNGVLRKVEAGGHKDSVDIAIHHVCLLAWKTADKMMEGVKRDLGKTSD